MNKNKWLIWSNEHTAWWRANSMGYVDNINDAGIYSFEDASKICHGANKFLPADVPPNETMLLFEVKEE